MVFCLPHSDWADGNLPEAAVELGKMEEHPNLSQPNPCPRADGTPCTFLLRNCSLLLAFLKHASVTGGILRDNVI